MFLHWCIPVRRVLARPLYPGGGLPLWLVLFYHQDSPVTHFFQGRPEVFPEWFFNPYHLHWVRVGRQMKTLVISAGTSTPYAELMVPSPF